MPYAGNPEHVTCMVTRASMEHDFIAVSKLDGSKMINGQDTMTLDGLKDHLNKGKPVVVGKFNHKGLTAVITSRLHTTLQRTRHTLA